MYEFSLLKSLYFEMDKYNMEGITEWKDGKRTFRKKEVSYPSVPEVTSITSEMRVLPYLDRYYIYINGEKTESSLHDPVVKQVIYEFYKDHFPQYLKKGLPDDLSGIKITDCFEVFAMPDYRPKYAYPGLITLEDLRAGRVHEEKPQFAWPGLELIANREQRDPDQPTISTFEGYEAFDGDRDKAKSSISDLKKKFAGQMKELNIDSLLEEIENKKKEAGNPGGEEA